MSDDDDDSGDDKSTASSSSAMSTASTSGGKGKAAAGGSSGLGLCLCLLGVLGVCAAGAVAAFVLLDEGGAGNRTDNATEAPGGLATTAHGDATGGTATKGTPTDHLPTAPQRRAGEDAPQLDAYGRFVQEQDKPLEAAVMSKQRARRNTTRRHSRVRVASSALEKQSNRDRNSETHSKHKAVSHHSTGDSRRVSHEVKSVVKHQKRPPATKKAGLRAGTVRRVSDEVSPASSASFANRTATKRVVVKNSVTQTTHMAEASQNTAHVVVSTDETPDASAYNRLNVTVRVQAGEGQTAKDAKQMKTGTLKNSSRGSLGGSSTSAATDDRGEIGTLPQRAMNSSVAQALTRATS